MDLLYNEYNLLHGINMESIENAAVETYTKNIEYFTNTHKHLIELISTLDLAVTRGDYEEEYSLEYIDGYFDIKNLKTGHYTYNQNSNNISKQITNRVTYSKKQSCFEGYPLYNFTDEEFEKTGGAPKLLVGMLPLMRYYIEHLNLANPMKEINKFMFVGVQLGLHIPMIHEKIRAKEYLIIEDNLEIFKLSLFTTKYYELGKEATLYFSVADTENLFVQTMKIYLQNTFYDNRYLKYSLFPGYSNNKLQHIQNALTTQSFVFFPYKMSLDKFLKPLEYINDGYNILNLDIPLINPITKNKPTLVLGAGPAFKQNIEWVKENHKKFIIIAASAVINTLHEHNIKPDILTHIDGQDISSEHFKNIDTKVFLKDAIVVFGSHVSSLVREKFTKQQIFYFEEDTYYFKDFGAFLTPCVGSFSLLFSLLMHTTDTYLLGLNFAVDQETGATHSSDHLEAQNIDMKDKSKLQQDMSFINNLLPVEGNFRETVYTNGLLHSSVQVLYQRIPMLKTKQQTIYNMNDGAMLNQATPKRIEDVDTAKLEDIDKTVLFAGFEEVFLKHSKQRLSPDDVMSLKKRLKNAKLVKKIIDDFESAPTSFNIDGYLYDILGVVSQIMKMIGRESNNLTHVFQEYFQMAIPTVIDFFNAKGLKNEKRHIKKLDKILVTEMHSICDIYISGLETFINERC